MALRRLSGKVAGAGGARSPGAGRGATIGVDIGGTKCLGVALDGDGVVVAEHRVVTPGTGCALLRTVTALVERLAPSVGGAALSVGVGAPGLVDSSGSLRFAPNLPGVVELALRDLLIGSSISGTRVHLENDATCAAWAETVMGAAAGSSHVLLATIGTGIGGGLIADGRLLRGSNGFAGEIGHMIVDPSGPRCPCGHRGCWEGYASGPGLGRMAREAARSGRVARVVALAGGDPETVRSEHVTIAAAEGDVQAREVMDGFARWVALGLANLANVMDPELIVLGGGMVETGEVLLEPVREAFAQMLEGAAHRPSVPIVAAGLGERAGAVGAALLARD